MPARWIPRAAALALAVSAVSCGGVPRFENPRCAQRYADCTDACADRCDIRGPVDDSRRPPTVDDNEMTHADCADCVDDCREAAARCEAETVPPGAP